MKERIEVPRMGGGVSQIVIGDVQEELEGVLPPRRVIVITDANVHRCHGAIIDRFEKIVIGMGETNKALHTIEKIYHELIELQADRECFILGFGGGIVTDVAGFAASTYMRGVGFGFVPTTLLAQVDASVGGKNGVNVEGFKNLAGVFNQPDFVICDPALLKSLPEREFCAGMAEVIKAGIIADPALFGLFECHTSADFQRDNTLLARAVSAAVRVKAAIVEADERENGVRRLLNLGHTFAHAIEKNSSDFLHGEAVAIGLAMAADLSVTLGLLAPQTAAGIRQAIARMHLPLESDIDSKRVLKALKLDKKRHADAIHFVLIKEIGDCTIRQILLTELEEMF